MIFKEPKKFLRFGAISLISLIAMSSLAYAADGFATPWQLGFQNSASPVMTHLTDFYNLLFIICAGITLFVLGLLFYVMVRFNEKANPVPSKTTHNTTLEIIWTLIPVILLIIIAIPSIKLLYYMDKVEDADMTIKVTGHQWFWEYEYQDHDELNFLSYIIPEDELKGDQKRLLETDNRVVLPIDTNIRILVTSADVLHAWAVPAFGIKIDAVPGQLNETWVRIEKEGVYYGQCSELCGRDHGFMPITIQAVPKEEFTQWMKTAQIKFSNAENLLPTKETILADTQSNNQTINIAYLKELK